MRQKMILKIGRVGKKLQEYVFQDDASFDDVFDASDIDYNCDENVIYQIGESGKRKIDTEDESPEDGGIYIIEDIKLTDLEISIENILSEYDMEVGDMDLASEKNLLNQIINKVKEANGWEK